MDNYWRTAAISLLTLALSMGVAFSATMRNVPSRVEVNTSIAEALERVPYIKDRALLLSLIPKVDQLQKELTELKVREAKTAEKVDLLLKLLRERMP